ncbi:MAG: KpsF/GutQ family sugar-phosphate isomerase [Deltaproteobacteria bacterium]|nr:KpsF/GutQ family sugar-phosphate isomerase [Deltaproteobacteria bacterium]
MDILTAIKEVVSLEIKALEDLLKTLDESFVKAIELIVLNENKLILSGMGKSGHIASKIAATLTSTGTGAVFLHPSEALHGDLGIVNQGDIVILLGKSGESDEIVGLIPSLKKLNCKIISITANPESTLAKHSDIVLYTPIFKEACALNLAPTCSTTAAMVVGDALAVTLMKIKNFKANDFALYHPAGRLGKRLLYKVSDLMKSGEENPMVYEDTPFNQVLEKISKGRMNSVSVVDQEGLLKGLITGFDLRKAFQRHDDLKNCFARDIMFPDPITTSPEVYAIETYELMKNSQKPINLLPVLEDGKAVGMITLQDLIRAGL